MRERRGALMRPFRTVQGTVLAAMLSLVVLLAACGGADTTPRSGVPTFTPSMVYVAIGASDAVGVGASDPNTTAYVPLLIARLPAHAYALNLGVNGYTVHQALANELPQALKAHPNVVTVWLVGNDIRQCTPLDSYSHDLDTLLGQLETKTKARVFVANTPDISLLPAFQHGAVGMGACLQRQTPAQIRAMGEQWNTVINATVARHHQVLVDLFDSGLASHPEYVSSDGFHPSDAGYKVLADLFWRQITAQHAIPGS